MNYPPQIRSRSVVPINSFNPEDVFEALENYRPRKRIEEFFRDEKQCVDGRRARIWHPDALRGRMFA